MDLSVTLGVVMVGALVVGVLSSILMWRVMTLPPSDSRLFVRHQFRDADIDETPLSSVEFVARQLDPDVGHDVDHDPNRDVDRSVDRHGRYFRRGADPDVGRSVFGDPLASRYDGRGVLGDRLSWNDCHRVNHGIRPDPGFSPVDPSGYRRKPE